MKKRCFIKVMFPPKDFIPTSFILYFTKVIENSTLFLSKQQLSQTVKNVSGSPDVSTAVRGPGTGKQSFESAREYSE